MNQYIGSVFCLAGVFVLKEQITGNKEKSLEEDKEMDTEENKVNNCVNIISTIKRASTINGDGESKCAYKDTEKKEFRLITNVVKKKLNIQNEKLPEDYESMTKIKITNESKNVSSTETYEEIK